MPQTKSINSLPNETEPSSLLRKRINWYLTRARVMTPTEVLHRFSQGFQLTELAARHSTGYGHPNELGHGWNTYPFCTRPNRQLPTLSWRAAVRREALDVLSEGRLPNFPFNWSWTGSAIDWHTAPDTGRQWPQQFFGTIPYRTGNPYGDARVMWEPGRLQQLVTLARAANEASTDEQRRPLVTELERCLISWWEANPPYTGIHYVSAMECALRIIAVCHALDMVRPWLTLPDETWSSTIKLVHSHAVLIQKRLSRHSSSGNHTVAEATGLLYAGSLFPNWPQSARWRSESLALLTESAAQQVLPTGEGIEQAFHYLTFISDLFGLTEALLHHQNHSIPPAITAAHQHSQIFLRHISQPSERTPDIGDSDSGHALSPDLRWTVPANQTTQTNTLAHYTVFRESSKAPVQAIWTHSPLGMAPCYGHGHADALALMVMVNGEPLLVDSGTYTYTGNAAWRTYFRSTRAHNTVTVNQQDQSVQQGSFMWEHPYTSQLVRMEATSDNRQIGVACHNGYQTRFGVTHWRAILYVAPGSWMILDRMSGSGVHTLELNWHLNVPLVSSGPRFAGHWRTHQVALTIQGGTTSHAVGATQPIRGWFSPQYGVKTPVTNVFALHTGELPFEFLSHLVVSTETPAPANPDDVTLLRRVLDEAQAH